MGLWCYVKTARTAQPIRDACFDYPFANYSILPSPDPNRTAGWYYVYCGDNTVVRVGNCSGSINKYCTQSFNSGTATSEGAYGEISLLGLPNWPGSCEHNR
jgi:hypothetical protein